MLHRFCVGAVAILSIGKLIDYCMMLETGAFTLNRAIFADTAAYALVYLFMHVMHRRYCVPREAAARYEPSAGERKRMFKYGLFNNFNDAGSLLLGCAADKFFIAAFINPVFVASTRFTGA